MAQKAQETNNWLEMFEGLYERLTGNNAEISCNFDDFEIDVPGEYG